MKCNYCGMELRDDVRFCSKCGKEVTGSNNAIPIQATQARSNTNFGEGTLMKTQVSILVRKESLYSTIKWKLFGHPFLWFLYIFKEPSGVNIWIDKGSENERYMELEQRSKPHMIDLEPGYHEIVFEDENAGSKGAAGFVWRLTAGLVLGAGEGGR